jgi:hypothetical protein
MTDDYVTVTTVLRAVRDLSIYVDRRVGGRPGDEVCIPRSLLFGGDDLRVAERGIGCEVKLRIRRWKADELGLLEDRHAGQGRLFG